jgi:hypothetical protein
VPILHGTEVKKIKRLLRKPLAVDILESTKEDIVQTFRQKLEKCRKSLEAHVARGGTPKALRGMHLIDRYNGLRNQRSDDESVFAEWAVYCKDHGFSHRHDAGDFFA